MVYGSQTGRHPGVISYNPAAKSVSLVPDSGFAPGEQVTASGIFIVDTIYEAGDRCNGVFAADLNNDGNLDIATSNPYANTVSVLINNGDGTYASHQDYPVAVEPAYVVAADLNSNGFLDLAAPLS